MEESLEARVAALIRSVGTLDESFEARLEFAEGVPATRRR